MYDFAVDAEDGGEIIRRFPHEKVSTLGNTSIYKTVLKQDRQDRLRRQDKANAGLFKFPRDRAILFPHPAGVADPAYPVLKLFCRLKC